MALSSVFTTVVIGGALYPQHDGKATLGAVFSTGALVQPTPRSIVAGGVPIITQYATGSLGSLTPRPLPKLTMALSTVAGTGVVGLLPGGPVYSAPPWSRQSPPFFCAELTITQPAQASAAPPVDQGHGSHPHGTLSDTPSVVSSTTSLLVSDAGYVTKPSDTGIAGSLAGVQSYAPVLTTAYTMQRALNLDPGENGVAASWGTISLINYNNQFDSIVANYVADNLPVRILYGYKTLENFGGSRGTRASPATYIGADGLMHLAPSNTPRVDYRTGAALPLFEGQLFQLLPNDLTIPTRGGSNTIAVSTEVPFLYEYAPIWKCVYANNPLFAFKSPTPNNVDPGASITGSMWVWVPRGLNPATVYHVALETSAGNSPSVLVDMTKVARWQRVSATFTNTTGTAATVSLVLKDDTGYINGLAAMSQQATVRTLSTPEVLAPDGTMTAMKVREDSATSEHRMNGPVAPSLINTVYTGSMFYKMGTRRMGCYAIRASAAVQGGIALIETDLITGQCVLCTQPGEAGAIAGGAIDAGNGWWRIWLTVKTVNNSNGLNLTHSSNFAGGTTLAPANLIFTTAATYTGDNASYSYIWGPQMDLGTVMQPYAGNYPTDYVYTTCWQLEPGATPTTYVPATGNPGSNFRAADQFVAARQNWIDPPYSNLITAFSGVATPWTLSDTQLDIPVRDGSYWAERPYNTNVYAGTGGYEGPASLTGVPKPILRGQVNNITPTLIDPANRIYQFNTGPGVPLAIYEGGAQVFNYAGDVLDLYVGTTPNGQWRLSSSKGMFQLGSPPVHQITIDAQGYTTNYGYQPNVAMMALYMLLDDMLIPAPFVDSASFTAANAKYPYPCGIYFDGTQTYTGVDAVAAVLGNFAAKLTVSRAGKLTMNVLRALPAGTLPMATLDPSNIVSLVPKNLPSTLQPPVYRWRVGWQHCWTVQTSDLNTGSITADHKAYIAMADRFATASSNAILTAFARPNDHNPIGGGLVNQADAQTVANDLLALWPLTRSLYTVQLPVQVGITLDIGNPVMLRYPAIASLGNGVLGVIVAETFNAFDATISFDILV